MTLQNPWLGWASFYLNISGLRKLDPRGTKKPLKALSADGKAFLGHGYVAR